MTTLVFNGLGVFEFTLNGTPITAFPTDKIRGLLIYLALEPKQPHRREHLASLFWPEMDGAAARRNLRLALYRLRNTLDDLEMGSSAALIISTPQTIQLNLDYVKVDLLRFQTLLARTNAHHHDTLHQCKECLARLTEAMTLYRGELLTGFGISDAPVYEEWLLYQREMVQQQALLTLKQLVDAYKTQGDYGQALKYALRLTQLDSYQEASHRELMRLQALTGFTDHALAQFTRLRQLLQDDLGVEPAAETVTLHEQIRAGKFDNEIRNNELGRQKERATNPRRNQSIRRRGDMIVNCPVPSVSPQAWNEAEGVTKLKGREAELAQLMDWLNPTSCRVIGLLGTGGVGKTTLAAATVTAVASQFDRVLWRSLQNAPLLDELLEDVLQLPSDANLHEIPSDLDAQLAMLLDELRQRRCLLVLENLEGILQPDQPGKMQLGYGGYAHLLQCLAEYRHQSCLLFTSRERPQAIASWEANNPLVRTLFLTELDNLPGQLMH